MTGPARPPRSVLGVPLSGTLWVAAGTVLLGASGYAFLTLTARRVDAGEYAALASLYLLVALVGPGLFVPVEQETTRLVSGARARGEGTRDQVLRIARLSAAMAAAAVVVLVALYPFLVDRVFHGSAGLWFALVASVLGYAGLNVARGVFAGQRRFRGYAAAIGVDGLVRLVPCAVFAGLGVSAALPYGLALGFGSVVALLTVPRWVRLGSTGPVTPWRDLGVAVGWLVAAWGLSLGLANIAPVVVTALLPDDPGRAGVFAFAFVIARVPVFLLISLQAILLPTLSQAAANRDLVALRSGVRSASVLVGALGVIGLVATAPLGRWLIGALFDARAAVSTLTLTLLALGTILAMFVQVLQPALIAIAGHRLVAAAWLAGAAVFTACFALPVGPIAAATVAQVAGGAVTATVMAAALRRRLRTHGGATRGEATVVTP